MDSFEVGNKKSGMAAAERLPAKLSRSGSRNDGALRARVKNDDCGKEKGGVVDYLSKARATSMLKFR